MAIIKKYFITWCFLLTAITAGAQKLRPIVREKVLPPNSKNGFHLYLLAGQSNMAGRGYPEAIDTMGNIRVLRLNKEGEWEIAKDPLHFDKPAAGVGPGLQFGKIMANADNSVVIGLIPSAVGGSGIAYWKKGAFYPATQTNPYDDAIARTKKAMQSGTLKGILWHQGEADSDQEKSSSYEDNLKSLINAFRADLAAPNVPFVAGELPDFQIYKEDTTGKKTVNIYAIQVNNAIAHLKKTVKNYGFVSAKNTKHRGDHLHFDATSARIMGERYAKQMLKFRK